MTDKELKRTEYELMECDTLLKLKVEQLTKYKELIDKIRNKCVDGLNYEEIDHYLEEDLKYILDLIKEYEDAVYLRELLNAKIKKENIGTFIDIDTYFIKITPKFLKKLDKFLIKGR